ncbi:Conserved_hypothetical protein [Hexamita inflata]|uniref:Uncharacterized protein n=1 Tax=Hexamita inflata TaxID=28002 RepID=A0AA86TTU6_9EUKA|nr:Conserved hypothetical protein [Hexamita inflata]
MAEVDELRQSWREFVNDESVNVSLEQSQHDLSISMALSQTRSPKNYVHPKERIQQYAQEQELHRSGQFEKNLVHESRVIASMTKIDINSFKTAIRKMKLDVARAYRAICMYSNSDMSTADKLTPSALFELFVSLNYVRHDSQRDKELIQKVGNLIDSDGIQNGYFELYDVQQFILALDTLAYTNAPKEYQDIMRSENILKHHSKAAQVEFMNRERLSRQQMSLTLKEEERERMRRLGVIGDQEICTFAPSTQINEEKAKSGDHRLVQKIQELGIEIQDGMKLHEKSVIIQKYKNEMKKINEEKLNEQKNYTFKPEITEMAKSITNEQSFVERMMQDNAKRLEKEEKAKIEKQMKEEQEIVNIKQSSQPKKSTLDKSILQNSPKIISEQTNKATLKLYKRMERARTEKNEFKSAIEQLGEPKTLDGAINKKAIESSQRLYDNKKQEKPEPLLQIEINITSTKVGKLMVYPGDQPGMLALNFCRIYSIGAEKYVALKMILEKTFEQNQIKFEHEEDIDYVRMLQSKADLSLSRSLKQSEL